GGGSHYRSIQFGRNGGNGGNITLSAQGSISTGYLRAYGGGGAAGNCYRCPAVGSGGNGGLVDIRSNSGSASVTISGDINVSGGGGGGSGNGSGTSGGNGGDVFISALGSVAITGVVLTAGG